MRRLDADDEVRILRHLGGGFFRIHVTDVAFVGFADHAVPDDVDKAQHAGLSEVDQRLFELVERAPARAATIDHRGRSRIQGRVVGKDAAGIAVNVHVQVDQAGRDDGARGVDGFPGLIGRDVARHTGDRLTLDSDVHDAVDLIGGIDQTATADQQIVLLRGERQRYRQQQHHDASMHGTPLDAQPILRPVFALTSAAQRRVEFRPGARLQSDPRRETDYSWPG